MIEFKEPGKDNFGELCPIINTACEAFLVGLAEKLAVIKKPLVVPAELSGVFRTTDELARLENQEDDRVLPTGMCKSAFHFNTSSLNEQMMMNESFLLPHRTRR